MSGPLSASHFKSRRAKRRSPTTPPRVEAARRGCGRNEPRGIFQTPIGRRVDRQIFHFTAETRAGFWQEALANLQNTIDEKVEESGLPDNLAALRDRALNTVDAARVTCRREIEAFKREQEEHFSRLDAEAAAAAADACVEINQRVGCTRQFFTKSFLGDDVAVLARSSGEEPASPRHRAGIASMAWRTTR